MISIIFTALLICLFFLLGHVTQAFKKLFGLVTKVLLKIASFFGIKIHNKEKTIKTSEEFKETYGEIKKVKLSKKNLKEVSSIDWVFLSLFIVAGLLILLNFGAITGNAISDWLYTIQPIKIISDETNMNTFFTATMFSILSFSISKVLYRWKETKPQRIERKQMKMKMAALKLMDSKELLDNAKLKDKQKRKELE